MVEAKRGHNGGTWGHPKLAVFFARWLGVTFAVWCDMVIDDILNKKAELTGKLHKNVMADIRKILAELGCQPAEFSARYIDALSKTVPDTE